MMKIFKVGFVGAVSLVALMFFVGCDILETNEDEANIIITAIGEVAIGSTQEVTGEISTSPGITSSGITITIENSSGADVSGSFAISQTNISAETEKIDIENDLALKFTPQSGVAGGTYNLKIKVIAGSAEVSKVESFTVPGGVQPAELTAKTVELGSWNNDALGSSLDADDMSVYLKSAAAGISSKIDIWYSNEARYGRGANVLYSPKQAGLAGHPPKDWTTQNETQMAVVSVSFSSITTQDALDALWAATTAKNQLIRATTNDVIVLKTNTGAIRLLQFVSGDATDAGKAVIKGK